MTTITIDTDLWDNPAIKGRPDRMGGFIWLLSKAIEGTLTTSYRKLADAFGWTLEAIRQFILALVNNTLINTATTQGGTLITICNHSVYYGCKSTNNTDATHPTTQQPDAPYIVPAHTDAPAPVINPSLSKKESKKEGSKKEDASAPPPPSNVVSISDQSQGFSKKASRLPSDWTLPRSWGQRAMTRGLTEHEVRHEAEKFRNYWLAKSGKDATKVRWDLTWDNWTLTAIERKGKSYGRPAEKSDTAMALYREAFGLDRDDQSFYPAYEPAITVDYQRCDDAGLF